MRVKKTPENNLKMFVTLLSRFDQNLQRIYYTCFEDTWYFYSNFLFNAKKSLKSAHAWSRSLLCRIVVKLHFQLLNNVDIFSQWMAIVTWNLVTIVRIQTEVEDTRSVMRRNQVNTWAKKCKTRELKSERHVSSKVQVTPSLFSTFSLMSSCLIVKSVCFWYCRWIFSQVHYSVIMTPVSAPWSSDSSRCRSSNISWRLIRGASSSSSSEAPL